MTNARAVALALCVAIGGAFAECAAAAPAREALDPTECPVESYDSLGLDADVDIPDIGFLEDPIGPIQFPDNGNTIVDVVMELEMQHTWVGNLVLTVTYDVECDGSNIVGPVRLLCRQGYDGCPEEYPACCGCSDDLITGGSYVFSDDGDEEMANSPEDCQLGPVAHGCYRPASESEFPLAVFDGLPRDGCWYMGVYDGAGGDVGRIHTWTIHLADDGATPVDAATWGSVKATYRE